MWEWQQRGGGNEGVAAATRGVAHAQLQLVTGGTDEQTDGEVGVPHTLPEPNKLTTQTDGQTDKPTDRQTYVQTDVQTDRHAHRQT